MKIMSLGKSIIEASTSGVRDLADGTLRITIDFEPKDAADAFALFGTRGRAVGIAALVDGRTQIKAEEEGEPITPEEPEKLKGGALAKLAGMWCNDPKFEKFWKSQFEGIEGVMPGTTDGYIKWRCIISSKRELDHNEEAAKYFHIIREEYREWLKYHA